MCFISGLIYLAQLILNSSDYATNELLDNYSDAGINDEDEIEPMTAQARRAAEVQMARRDRLQQGGRGTRASRRSRYSFLDDGMDEEEDLGDDSLTAGTKRRTRKQYDERRDQDDMDGVENVRFVEAFFLHESQVVYRKLYPGSNWVISKPNPL